MCDPSRAHQADLERTGLQGYRREQTKRVKPIPDVCGIWIIDVYGELRFLTMSKKRDYQKGDCDHSEDKYGGEASHGAPPLVSTRI